MDEWVPEQTGKFIVIVFHGALEARAGGSCGYVCLGTLAHTGMSASKCKEGNLVSLCCFSPYPCAVCFGLYTNRHGHMLSEC